MNWYIFFFLFLCGSYAVGILTALVFVNDISSPRIDGWLRHVIRIVGCVFWPIMALWAVIEEWIYNNN